MTPRTSTTVLLVGIVAAVAVPPSAAAAKAYVGCQLQPRHVAVSTLVAGGAGGEMLVSSVGQCHSACKSLNHAIYTVSLFTKPPALYKCTCSSTLPPILRFVPNSRCVSSNGTVALASFLVSSSKSWGCRIEDVPMLPSTTAIAYNPPYPVHGRFTLFGSTLLLSTRSAINVLHLINERILYLLSVLTRPIPSFPQRLR